MKPIAALLILAAPLFCQPQRGMGSGSAAPPARRSPRLAGVKPPPILFRDTAASWGITSSNSYGGATTKRFILEMTGNGVALIDYDNDGRLDIFLPNGAQSPGVLYRNLGTGKFADVTRETGLLTSGWTQGACAGDLDNDGWTDLVVTRYGSNQLWRNEAGRRFRDITVAAGLATPGELFHTGCALTDYDRDGRLDLFVSNYVGFSLKTASTIRPLASPFCNWRGLDVFCGPRGLAAGVNHLFHNEGGGRFRDVSVPSGIRAVDGLHYGLGAVASDVDGDGWPDLYVACDSTPSLLYHNQRDGTFKESAVGSGVAYGEHGEEQGGMGVSLFDYDNDARLDILRTNFIDETTALYHNDGDLYFSDATVSGGFAVNTGFVSWGVSAVDLDQDGWRDLVIANGHIYPELARKKGGVESFEQSRLVYWNARNGAFADVSSGAGQAITDPRCSRGLASGDLDGDGAPELVVVNQNGAPMVLRNETASRGNWLIVKLAGTRSNRSGIGARVTLSAPAQMGEVQSGGSYLSQSDLRLHFGMGAATAVEKLEVHWPSGTRQTLTGVKANQVLVVTEPAP